MGPVTSPGTGTLQSAIGLVGGNLRGVACGHLRFDQRPKAR